ncbi:hypothetical protein BDY21DRAFT_362497 [Lineolata rhizophorae]|uniref:Uncharacterized protein n=1 Tax=Lineolata rhizophorae TaxID=578093 RepID=A0A6A6P5G4_9PEZI|nr:hypothetical protein BDY21DRAFT_362497 [Lineolata rhizophorae]
MSTVLPNVVDLYLAQSTLVLPHSGNASISGSVIIASAQSTEVEHPHKLQVYVSQRTASAWSDCEAKIAEVQNPLAENPSVTGLFDKIDNDSPQALKYEFELPIPIRMLPTMDTEVIKISYQVTLLVAYKDASLRAEKPLEVNVESRGFLDGTGSETDSVNKATYERVLVSAVVGFKSVSVRESSLRRYVGFYVLLPKDSKATCSLPRSVIDRSTDAPHGSYSIIPPSSSATEPPKDFLAVSVEHELEIELLTESQSTEESSNSETGTNTQHWIQGRHKLHVGIRTPEDISKDGCSSLCEDICSLELDNATSSDPPKSPIGDAVHSKEENE